MSPAAALTATSWSRLRAAWDARAPRERALLGAAAVVILVALLWSVVLQPALRTLRTAPVELRALGQDMQRMQALQARAEALRATPELSAATAQEQFNAQTQHLLGASAQTSQAGGLLRVQITAVDATVLAQWLTAVGQEAHLRPASADLRRAPATATGAPSATPAVQWSGTVTFNLPS